MREIYIKKTSSYLSYLLTILRLENSQGYVDINSVIEDTTALLLNEIYDWDLENLNKKTNNYPAIDLADYKNKVAVQVTTNTRSEKIQHTIDEYIKNKYYTEFERLIIFQWTDVKSKTKSSFETMNLVSFVPEKDIITVPMLLSEIKVLQTTKIKTIAEMLQSEIVVDIADNEKKKLDEGQLDTAIDEYTKDLLEHKSYSKCFDKRLMTSVSIKGGNDERLDDLVNDYKDENVFCYGEGGIGKTFALLYLRERLDEKGVLTIYIPLKRLNVNRYGADALKEWIKDRILSRISKCGQNDLDDLYNVFSYSISHTVSRRILFVLDGVNEVKQMDFCKSFIDEWIDRPNVSIIVSSRNLELVTSGYTDMFLPLKFNSLKKATIINILRDYNHITEANNNQLLELLSTPQLIMWFLGTANFGDDVTSNQYLDIREIHYQSDLFHNYFESEIQKLAKEIHICSWFEAVLLINYIIPAIAWEMYLSGESALPFKVVNNSIFNIVKHVNAFDSIFPNRLSFTYNEDIKLDSRKLLGIVLHNMEIFEFDENKNIRFSHENYIPILIIIHWINCARDILETGSCLTGANCWNDYIIPANSIQYISTTKGSLSIPDTAVIDDYWEYQRNNRFSPSDLQLMNLIRVYSDLRQGDLKDLDFSNMDLRFSILNGASFGDDFNGAKFCHSIISSNTFAPQGQHAAIMQIYFKNNSNNFYIRDFHGNLAKIERAIDKKDWSVKCDFTNNYPSKFGIIESVSNDTEVFYYKLYYIMDGWLHDWCVCYRKIDSSQAYEYRLNLEQKIIRRIKAFLYLGSKKRFLVAIRNRIYLLDETTDSLSDYNLIGEVEESLRVIDMFVNSSESAALVCCQDNEHEKLVNYNVDLNAESLTVIPKSYEYFSNSIIQITNDGEYFIYNLENRIHLASMNNGETIHKINEELKDDEKIHIIKISDDNNWLVLSIISESMTRFRTSIWEVNHELKYREYMFDELVSAISFSPDNKYIIMGLWNGTIEEIELLSGNRRICVHGNRVDQYLSIVNKDLFVRRSDGTYSVWDYKNRRIRFKPQHYLLKEFKQYMITENGRYWYKIDNKGFHYCEEGDRQINLICFEHEPTCFTTANDNGIYICLKWISDGFITLYRVSLHNKLETTRFQFDAKEMNESRGQIREICVNKDGSLIAILFEEHVEDVDYLDCGPRHIILLDTIRKEVIFNVLIEDNATRQLGEKFKLFLYDDNILVLLLTSSELYVVNIKDKTINDLRLTELLYSYAPKNNEIADNEMRMISPKGAVTKSKIMPTPNTTIAKAAMTDSGKLVLGYTGGLVLCIDFASNKVAAYGASNHRISDMVVIDDGNNEICFTSQKDDKIHIFDIKNKECKGYLYTMPNTYITNCDFTNASFESSELKELIKMNGAIVIDHDDKGAET